MKTFKETLDEGALADFLSAPLFGPERIPTRADEILDKDQAWVRTFIKQHGHRMYAGISIEWYFAMQEHPSQSLFIRGVCENDPDFKRTSRTWAISAANDIGGRIADHFRSLGYKFTVKKAREKSTGITGKIRDLIKGGRHDEFFIISLILK